MPVRIGPKTRRKIFLAEWRDHKNLTQQQLADRLETHWMTISRWELGKVLMNTDAMQAVADALGIEPEDLWHHPDQPTPNQLLRDQPPSVEEQAINLIRAIRRS